MSEKCDRETRPGDESYGPPAALICRNDEIGTKTAFIVAKSIVSTSAFRHLSTPPPSPIGESRQLDGQSRNPDFNK